MRNADAALRGGCWLHRSKGACVFAVAFWTWALALPVFEMARGIHPRPAWVLIPACGLIIWALADYAAGCKQRLEQSFYWIGAGYFLILAAHSAVAMSAVPMRVSLLAEAAVSGTEILLAGAILRRHLRRRTDGSGSKWPTRGS